MSLCDCWKTRPDPAVRDDGSRINHNGTASSHSDDTSAAPGSVILDLLVERLKNCDLVSDTTLAPPPGPSASARSELRATVESEVRKKLMGVVTTAAGSIPIFGNLVSRLCEEIDSRWSTVKDAEAEAERVARLTRWLAQMKFASSLEAYFSNHAKHSRSSMHNNPASELMQLLVFALRLVTEEYDAKRSKIGAFFHTFFRCNGLKDALTLTYDRLSESLFKNITMYVSIEVQRNKGVDNSHVKRILEAVNADTSVHKFWSESNGFSDAVGVNTLMDALENYWRSSQQGQDPAMQRLARASPPQRGLPPPADRLAPPFPVLKRMLAGASNSETVTIQRFLLFVGSQPLDDALHEHLAYQQKYAQKKQQQLLAGTVACTSSFNPFTDSAEETPVLDWLRDTLNPVDFGDDLIEHHGAYTPNTRGWVLRDFRSWISNAQGEKVFWIKAGSGMGKSVLSSQLVRLFGSSNLDERQSVPTGQLRQHQQRRERSRRLQQEREEQEEREEREERERHGGQHHLRDGGRWVNLVRRLGRRASHHEDGSRSRSATDSSDRSSRSDSRTTASAPSQVPHQGSATSLDGFARKEEPSSLDDYFTKGETFIAAHFFCRHDLAERNDPLRAITTIAYRLATQLPSLLQEYKRIMHDANEHNAFCRAARNPNSLDDAFEKVLREPLLKATQQNSSDSDRDIVILIDALDELREGTSKADFLRLIGHRLSQLAPRLRLVISSSKDPAIASFFNVTTRSFEINKSNPDHQHDVEDYVIDAILPLVDMRRFTPAEAGRQRQQLQLDILRRADHLFLGAALIHKEMRRIVREEGHLCTVETVRGIVSGDGELTHNIFKGTLKRADECLRKCAASTRRDVRVLRHQLRGMLAVVVSAQGGLCERTLRTLLAASRWSDHTPSDLDENNVFTALHMFYPASSPTTIMEPFHKQLTDYLTSTSEGRGEAGWLVVDTLLGHALLALACLAVLRDPANELLTAGIEPLSTETSASYTSSSSSSVPATGSRSGVGSEAVSREPSSGIAPLSSIGSGVKKYAALFGHRHLQQCADALAGSRTDIKGDTREQCERALDAWSMCFLDDNTCRGGSRFDAGGTRSLLSHAAGRGGLERFKASGELARWLLLQACTMDGAKRLVIELQTLAAAIPQDTHPVMSRLLREVAAHFGTHWAPYKGDVLAAVGGFQAAVTAGSPLHDSECLRVLCAASNHPLLQRCMPPFASAGLSSRQLLGHSGRVNSVAFSKCSTLLVTTSDDATVRVWKAVTAEEIACCRAHVGAVRTAAFTRNHSYGSGKMCVVSGGDDGALRVWRFEQSGDTKQIERMHEGRAVPAHGGQAVRWLSFNDNGRVLVSGGYDCMVRLWKKDHSGGWGAWGELCHLAGHTAPVKDVCFGPDNYIASGGDDGHILVWHGTTRVRKISCGFKVRSMAMFKPRASSRRTSSSVHPPDTPGAGGHANSVEIGIVAGGDDPQLKIWTLQLSDADRGAYADSTGPNDTCVSVDACTHGGIYSVTIDSQRGWALVGTNDYEINLWGLRSKRVRFSYRGHVCTIMAVAFSPDGKHFASGGTDACVKVWDAPAATQPQQQEGGEYNLERVRALAFTPNGGAHLVAGGSKHRINMWELGSGKVVRRWCGHTDVVSALAVSPVSQSGGHVFLSAGHDKTVRSWATQQQQQQQQQQKEGRDGLLEAEDRQGGGDWEEISLIRFRCKINDIALNGKGTQAVLACDDGKVRLVSVDENGRLGPPTELGNQHSAALPVLAVAFSADGSTVVSGGESHEVVVWSTAAGDEPKRLRGHKGVVASVTISSRSNDTWSGSSSSSSSSSGDGHGGHGGGGGLTFASGSQDRTVRIWKQGRAGMYTVLVCPRHQHGVRDVAFNSKGDRLVSAANDRMLRVWDVSSGDMMARCHVDFGFIYAVAFQPGSDTAEAVRDLILAATSSSVQNTPRSYAVACGSLDGRVRLWQFQEQPDAVVHGREGPGSLEDSVSSSYSYDLSVPFTGNGPAVTSDYDDQVNDGDGDGGKGRGRSSLGAKRDSGHGTSDDGDGDDDDGDGYGSGSGGSGGGVLDRSSASSSGGLLGDSGADSRISLRSGRNSRRLRQASQRRTSSIVQRHFLQRVSPSTAVSEV